MKHSPMKCIYLLFVIIISFSFRTEFSLLKIIYGKRLSFPLSIILYQITLHSSEKPYSEVKLEYFEKLIRKIR